MKKIWVLLLLPGWILVEYFNVDTTVIPWLIFKGHTGVRLFLWAYIVATFGLLYRYVFYGLLTASIKESSFIKKEIPFAKKVLAKMAKFGIIGDVVEEFHKVVNGQHKLISWIKEKRYQALLALGANPGFGTRTPSVIFCATIGWTKGLAVLVLANSIHILFSVVVWSLLHHFFGRIGTLVLMGTIYLAVILLAYRSAKRAISKKTATPLAGVAEELEV